MQSESEELSGVFPPSDTQCGVPIISLAKTGKAGAYRRQSRVTGGDMLFSEVQKGKRSRRWSSTISACTHTVHLVVLRSNAG